MAFAAKMEPTREFLNRILRGGSTGIKDGYLYGEIEVAIDRHGWNRNRDQVTFRIRDGDGIMFVCGPIDLCDIGGIAHLTGIEIRGEVSFDKKYCVHNDPSWDEWNW